jgi:hypothetical protein
VTALPSVAIAIPSWHKPEDWTTMSRRAALGTIEWFKREKLHLIEIAKATDSFGAARRSFQKLVDLGSNGDPDLTAALHTSAVINYARPFVNNTRADGVRVAFPKNVVKAHTNFVDEVHQELIDLRQKLVAHSDRDYGDGRLFRKLLALDIEGEHTEFLVGATVATLTVQTMHDMALAERFLSHIRAVEEAAYTAATKRLEDFVRAGQRFPQQLQNARSAGAKPRIKTERFEMRPDEAVSVPAQMLNPHAVLTHPPLKLGPGGYVFRGFAVHVDVSTEITRTADNGSKRVFRLDVAKAAD